MSEYYMENFESYSQIFRHHALATAQLMRILDAEVIGSGLPPVGRVKELFRMTLDLQIPVDREYKKVNNLEDTDPFMSSFYMRKDEVISAMRDILKEELAHYLEARNGDLQ